MTNLHLSNYTQPCGRFIEKCFLFFEVYDSRKFKIHVFPLNILICLNFKIDLHESFFKNNFKIPRTTFYSFVDIEI